MIKKYYLSLYHRRTEKLIKETAEKEFCKPCKGCFLYCSIWNWSGVKGANFVIHLSPFSAHDDYLRECARAGQDSTYTSYAVLLNYKKCTRSKNISREMKDYVRNTEHCRRVLPLKEFADDPQRGDVGFGHKCCEICTTSW